MNKDNLDFDTFAAKLILNRYDSDKAELEIEKYYNENFNREQKIEIDKFIRNAIHKFNMIENKEESLNVFEENYKRLAAKLEEMVLGNKTNTLNEERFHLEEKELLVEMATLYKGKIIVEVYSNDHNPAHCHVLDSNKNELNRVLIDGNCPKDKSDIKIYEGETMNMEVAERKFFINWVNLVDEDGISNWRNLQRTWQLFHNYKN